MDINPTSLSSGEIYKILSGSVLPRPIAWVSTLDTSGKINLAPFSFFTVASVNPPVLCFSPLISDNKLEKDTLRNILQTGEFIINVVSYDLVEQMNQTSAPYPAGVNEFMKAGVTPSPSTAISAPGVKEALIRFECTLNQILPFGLEPMAGNLILGDICHIHLHPDVYKNGKVDCEVLDPVGRLSGIQYSTIRDHFEIKRPTVLPSD